MGKAFSGYIIVGAAHAQGDTLTDDSAVAALWDAQVAQLAMASILIDTMNLKDENKTKDHDRKAVEFLEAKIGLCGKVSKDFQRDTFFEKINEAKKDLDSLALRDILRKDYKQWTENGMNLGMSSIVKPLSFLRSKAQDEGGEGSNEAFVNALKKFAKERKLGVFAIMTAFTSEDGAFSRELLTMSSHSDGQKVLEKFADSKGSDLELEDDNGKEEDGLYLRMWRQKNVSCSRKQVAPMLRSAMS
ncbi:Exopolyphosphatase [Taxawa tesnikishii (nom. ined.)]|nr:Exopolyphosphatase [Dothideales sp. JES 119]